MRRRRGTPGWRLNMGVKTALAPTGRASSGTLDGVQYVQMKNGCPEAVDPSQLWVRPLASALISGPTPVDMLER